VNLYRRGTRIHVIDVRTPVEFEEVHLDVARNIPLDRLTPELVRQMTHGSNAAFYVICQTGGRGRQACEKLAATGITHVMNVEGGTAACEAAGLPVIRGRKSISLERQVRIAAGTLVLIGSMLGYFVHPYWIALSAFVGAGLVFAGVTDTCGMGMLLARMPWNQAGPGHDMCTPPLHQAKSR
jgi:rhodanese-related sulfurtransferase